MMTTQWREIFAVLRLGILSTNRGPQQIEGSGVNGRDDIANNTLFDATHAYTMRLEAKVTVSVARAPYGSGG